MQFIDDILERSVVSFKFALGYWRIVSSINVFEVLDFEELLEIFRKIGLENILLGFRPMTIQVIKSDVGLGCLTFDLA
jgi:hypothetical protein